MEKSTCGERRRAAVIRRVSGVHGARAPVRAPVICRGEKSRRRGRDERVLYLTAKGGFIGRLRSDRLKFGPADRRLVVPILFWLYTLKLGKFVKLP